MSELGTTELGASELGATVDSGGDQLVWDVSGDWDEAASVNIDFTTNSGVPRLDVVTSNGTLELLDKTS